MLTAKLRRAIRGQWYRNLHYKYTYDKMSMHLTRADRANLEYMREYLAATWGKPGKPPMSHVLRFCLEAIAEIVRQEKQGNGL